MRRNASSEASSGRRALCTHRTPRARATANGNRSIHERFEAPREIRAGWTVEARPSHPPLIKNPCHFQGGGSLWDLRYQPDTTGRVIDASGGDHRLAPKRSGSESTAGCTNASMSRAAPRETPPELRPVHESYRRRPPPARDRPPANTAIVGIDRIVAIAELGHASVLTLTMMKRPAVVAATLRSSAPPCGTARTRGPRNRLRPELRARDQRVEGRGTRHFDRLAARGQLRSALRALRALVPEGHSIALPARGAPENDAAVIELGGDMC